MILDQILICKECGNKLISRDQKKYCSSSCAAVANNRERPAGTRPRKTGKCKHCKAEVWPHYLMHCKKCQSEGRHRKYGKNMIDYTIEEICKRYKSNRYDNIRAHAHKRYKNRIHKCEKCSYNKHTEVCHIKPISSFAKITKIGIVNSRENIMFLCPNCHWEHDHALGQD